MGVLLATEELRATVDSMNLHGFYKLYSSSKKENFQKHINSFLRVAHLLIKSTLLSYFQLSLAFGSFGSGLASSIVLALLTLETGHRQMLHGFCAAQTVRDSLGSFLLRCTRVRALVLPRERGIQLRVWAVVLVHVDALMHRH